MVITLKIAIPNSFSRHVFIYATVGTINGFLSTLLLRLYYNKLKIIEKPVFIILLNSLIIGVVFSYAQAYFQYFIVNKNVVTIEPFYVIVINFYFVYLLWNSFYFLFSYFDYIIVEVQKRMTEVYEKEKAQREVYHYKNEVDIHSKELMAKTLILSKHNDTINEISDEINNTTEDKSVIIRKVQTLINNAKSDQSAWDEFYFWFNKANEGFFDTLKKHAPDLSQKEMQICAYLKMNLSSKEISSLAFLTVGTIEQYRIRIRKKLKLKKFQNLQDSLNKL